MKTGMITWQWVVAVFIAVLATVILHGPALAANAKMMSDDADGTNWPSVGRTYSENYFSPLTQISDKMKQQLPSGVINANIAAANVYGNTIRSSGVCDGA